MHLVRLILYLVFPILIYAQNNTTNDYFESMDGKLNIKLGLDNDIESFNFDDGITKYNIVPNSSLRTSISANTRFLTIRVGYSPAFLANEDTDEKGETTVFKFNLDIFINKWFQTFDYSSVKGYYINEVSNRLIEPESPYTILPNLKTLRVGGQTSYVMNDIFSLKSVVNQYEIQRKSAGSFIPSLTYQYLKLDGDDNEYYEDLRSFDLLINAGYFYTFVINQKWYANLGLSPGLGVEFNKEISINNNIEVTNKSSEMVFNINTLIGLGYNSKNFYGGVKLRGIATTRDEESLVQFSTVRGITQLFVGYRFKSPKFLKKSFDWIENQNPFN